MKKILVVAALAVTHTFASAIDLVMPFPAGGSSSAQMQVIVPELEALGVKVEPQFLPNCQTQQSMRGTRPMLWLWANDVECKQPPKVNENDFVALLVYQPLYLCGKTSSLKDYATGSPRLAINTAHYKDLVSAIIAKVNPNIKVVNYANSTQVRTAMKTNEVELSLTTVGPAMVAEGAATCYAVTADKPIGDVTSNIVSQTGQTGTINYSTFMDKVVAETQSYFTNVVNKNRETVNQYNNAVRQQWMMERVYTEGRFKIEKTKDTILFGKSYNLEKRTDEIFGQLVKDIKNGDEAFIQFISDKSKKFSNKLIRQVRENYSNFVRNKRSTFQSAVTNITNSMVAVQQSYIGYIGRINTITYSAIPNTGTDGYQQSNGQVFSYILYPTTEVDASSAPATNTLVELENDVKKINSGITEFNKIIWSANTFTYDSKSYTGTLVFKTPYKLPSGE
jgi:hypothetical protein